MFRAAGQFFVSFHDSAVCRGIGSAARGSSQSGTEDEFFEQALWLPATPPSSNPAGPVSFVSAYQSGCSKWRLLPNPACCRFLAGLNVRQQESTLVTGYSS